MQQEDNEDSYLKDLFSGSDESEKSEGDIMEDKEEENGHKGVEDGDEETEIEDTGNFEKEFKGTTTNIGIILLVTLFPYQTDTCNECQTLEVEKGGGVLADDMGLGKTSMF